MMAHINSPSIWEAEAGESRVSGYLQLHTKFKDSLVSIKEKFAGLHFTKCGGKQTTSSKPLPMCEVF